LLGYQAAQQEQLEEGPELLVCPIWLGVRTGVAGDTRAVETGGGVGSGGTGFGWVDTGIDGFVWLACSKAVAKAWIVAKCSLGPLVSAFITWPCSCLLPPS
jgi:hypothetical protein